VQRAVADVKASLKDSMANGELGDIGGDKMRVSSLMGGGAKGSSKRNRGGGAAQLSSRGV